MRRPSVDGNFMFCFALNLIFNAYWAIPAVILFVAHFVVGTPLWIAWLALGLWIAITFAITLFLGWDVAKGEDASEPPRYTRHSSSQNQR